MNQEESEHSEVDGMKKGADSTGEVMSNTGKTRLGKTESESSSYSLSSSCSSILLSLTIQRK